MEFAQRTEMEPWMPTRLKSSAIFAGWSFGLAIQIALALLGLAIGAWMFDVREAEPMSGIPLGTALWTAASAILAAFAGGYLAARMSGATRRSDGMYHGAVVWAVNWIVFAWLTTTAMSFAIGGVFSILGTTIKTLTQSATGMVTAAAGDGGSVSVEPAAIRRQVEELLASTGKPELQPGEVRRDVQNVADEARRGDKPLGEVAEDAWAELQNKLAALDRGAAVNVLVNKFGVAEARAQEIVDRVIGAINRMTRLAEATASDIKQQATQATNAALNRLGSAAWWLFVMAILTLAASAGAGRLGTTPAAYAPAAYEPAAARRAG